MDGVSVQQAEPAAARSLPPMEVTPKAPESQGGGEPGLELVEGISPGLKQKINVSQSEKGRQAFEKELHSKNQTSKMPSREDRGCCVCCPIIDEVHPFRRKWDMVQVAALFYVAILVPIRTGFAIELKVLTIEWMIELCVDVSSLPQIWRVRTCDSLGLFCSERMLVLTWHVTGLFHLRYLPQSPDELLQP